MAESAIQILKSLKSENLKSLYFLHGAESYYPNAVAKRIIQIAIPEHEKGFNEFILFGKDLTVGAVLNNARRFPMMAERQLVVIKDAQLIQDINTKAGQDLLNTYAKDPLQSTILVLVFGKTMDARKGYLKTFGAKGVLLNSKKLYDNQVPDFIIGICHEKQHKISPKAALLLYEHTGNNLESIVQEIEKMLINLNEREEINGAAIEKYVGISKDYNTFELQKALVNKDLRKSFQIINYFSANTKDHPIQPVVSILFNFFSKVLLMHGGRNKAGVNMASLLKVNPYFLKDYEKAARNFSVAKLISIISTLRNTDKYSKGIESGTKSPSDLYKDMIYGILGK